MMKLGRNIHHVSGVGTAEKVVMGQRSRSRGDGLGNLVNSIAAEQLKGFEQTKVIHVLSI